MEYISVKEADKNGKFPKDRYKSYARKTELEGWFDSVEYGLFQRMPPNHQMAD